MIRKKNLPDQGEFWVRREDVKLGKGKGFYDRLARTLEGAGFGERVRSLCKPYYSGGSRGRPPIDPEVYFKMLLVGFFEGVGSERGIAARCEDSLMVRRFLRYDITEATPDHSTLSVIRYRLPEEVYLGVFDAVLLALREAGLLKGEKLGFDSSTMEANASLEKLRHRLTGESYWEYVRGLAEEAGVDPGDAAAVRRFDRAREGRKTSNKEWFCPGDPDAKIGRRKDGACDMIYKPEHAVDLDSGALVGVGVLPGDQGDSEGFAERALETSALLDAMEESESGRGEEREEVEEHGREGGGADGEGGTKRDVTADKGYHQNDEIGSLHEAALGVVIPAPEGKELPCEETQEALHKALRAARDAVASDAGKALLKARAEKVERSFAHLLDCGGMRRTTLRGRLNIAKRYLVAGAAFNLSVLLKSVFRYGTPKQFAAGNRVGPPTFFAVLRLIWPAGGRTWPLTSPGRGPGRCGPQKFAPPLPAAA